MRRILFTVLLSGFFTKLSEAQTTAPLSASEGDTVTLVCSLSGTFTFPVWQGPPSLLKYTNQDVATINSNAPAASRLKYASNNKDLILSNVKQSDSGDYQCSYALLGDHTITLTVTETIATTTSTTPTTKSTTPTATSTIPTATRTTPTTTSTTTPTTTNATPTTTITTPTTISTIPPTTSVMPAATISTTATSTTTVVIIALSVVGGLLVVGIVIAALFIFHRQGNKKHATRNESHLGRNHHKQYETSKSPYQRKNDYLNNSRSHNGRSQVKENPLHRVSKERSLSRSYYTGASSRYDNYRPVYTMEHVYPSDTGGHRFMSEYIGGNRNPKNPKHSFYPMGNMRYTDNKIFYY